MRQKPCSFASGKGHLFIAHPSCEPIWIDYSQATDTFTVTEYTIQIRDFDGIEDNLDVGENPTSLSAKHKYNLFNQGWFHEAGVIDVKNEADDQILDAYFNEWSEYPANSEQWWNYKSPDDYYDPRRRTKVPPTNTEAPKGHYVYNAFDINREETSGISNLTNYNTTKRPGALAFYAGRVWYAGVGDSVWYTQVVENERQYGICYQKNDPTDENLSDLLDTDGGVIKLLGMGNAVALFAAGNNLYVFATNGIWVVSGSGAEGTGFVATDFAVRRISTVPLQTVDSLLDVEGTPIWWNLEGIWTIQQSQTGSIEVMSLSHDTIKTFLADDCPVENRPYIQGAYNPSERTIQWLYRSDEATTTTESYAYNRILEFNTSTGAFYPFKWTTKRFHSIICVTNISVETNTEEAVEDSATNAITKNDGLTAVVIDTEDLVEFTSSQFKYFIVNTDDDTVNILEEEDEAYKDFKTIEAPDGFDFESYFITGAMLYNKGHVGTMEYATVFCKVVDNGSIYLQLRWDWANASAANKWSTSQQCYTVNRTNRDVSRKRLLTRGSGPAVQLKFTSQTGKPFNIIGWSGAVTIDATP
jgi:hypothetical protein